MATDKAVQFATDITRVIAGTAVPVTGTEGVGISNLPPYPTGSYTMRVQHSGLKDIACLRALITQLLGIYRQVACCRNQAVPVANLLTLQLHVTARQQLGLRAVPEHFGTINFIQPKKCIFISTATVNT